MRKLFILFTFLCVSVMGFAATQYCGETSSNANFTFSLMNVSGNTYRIQFDAVGDANEKITSINLVNIGVDQTGGAGMAFPAGDWVVTPDRAYVDFTTASGSSVPTNFYTWAIFFGRAGGGENAINSGTPSDVDWTATCGGGGGSGLTDPQLSLNETAVTLDATVPEIFSIIATQLGDGAISYESSNSGIASVDNTGTVTAVGRGTATITVRTAETATYAADSETLTVTVNGPINWNSIGWLGNGSGNAAYTDKYKVFLGDPAPSNVVNIQTPGWPISISGPGIYVEYPGADFGDCSIADDKMVKYGAGVLYYMTAFTTQETVVSMEVGGVARVFTVYFADGTTGGGSLSESDLTRTSSAAVVLDVAATSSITHTTSSTGAITYTTSDPSVASVSNSGVITAQAFGEATITVSQVADASYEAGSFTVAVSVNMPKKASVKSYGSLRMTDVQLYDIAANVANTSNPCGKVDLYVVTFGNDIVYKAIVKDDKAFENCTDYFCQLRTWKSDMTTMKEQCALQCSGDLKTRTLVLPQATRYEGLSFYDSEMKLTSYMVLTGCGARTMKTVSYTRDYVNNVDESDVTAPVLGAATVTPGVDDITVSFDAVTSEEVFYLIEDAAHNKKFCSIEPSFVIAKDGSGVTYNYSCYAIDYNGNVSAAQTAVVEMPFDGSIDLALNKPCEAGSNQNENTNASKANDGLDTNWETGGGVAYENQWWYVDLGDTYNLDNITIRFENARSNHFLLQGRTSAPNSAQKVDDNAWNVLKEVSVEPAGDYALNEYDVTGKIARYVRFKSLSNTYTNAYGCKIREFCVYGTSIAPVDAEAPSMTSASLVSSADTYAVIAVAATDNQGIACFHVEDEGNSFVGNFVAEAGNITVTDLTGGTSYTFVITAVDFFGNESENSKSVSVNTTAHYTEPQAACTAPEWDAALVKAIYSPTYSADCNFANWAGCTAYTADTYGKKFAVGAECWGFGLDGFTLNCVTMQKLHADIWVADDASLRLVPIYGGTGLTTDDSHGKMVNLEGQTWNSIDLTLASDFAGLNLSSIFQFKIDNANGLTFWIGNLYFYRESAIVDNEDPVIVSASITEIGFNSVKITVQATDDSGAVDFSVKNGDVEVATAASASGEEKVITVTGLTAGTTYNLKVVASDGANNKAESSLLTARTKVIPPAAPAPDFTGMTVVPVYTDAMAGGPTINIGGWGQSTVALQMELASEDNAYYLTNYNHLGWEFAEPHVNATGMNYLHADVYAPSMTQIGLTPISPGHELSTLFTLTPGAWTSLDIPLSTFALGNIEWDNVFQFKFDRGDGTGELFIDNVYFYYIPEISFADDADNSTVISDNNGKLVAAEINRDILANGEWFTLCVPFDMDAAKVNEVFGPSTIATLVNAEDRGSLIHLNFDYVKAIEAGKPYIIKPSKTFNEGDIMRAVTIKNVAPIQVGDALMKFQGTYNPITLDEENQRFVGPENYLYAPEEGGTVMGAFRCYFTIPSGSSAGAPGKRARIVFGEQVATSIDNVSDNIQCIKVMKEGVLYIIRDGRTYNAQGMLVK